MNPVDLAAKRREADLEELHQAKLTKDWPRAFDVLHANFLELERLQIRSIAKHDDTHQELSQLRALMMRTFERIGDIVVAQEQTAIYRPTRASASSIDAQALGQTIEGVYAELKGDTAALSSKLEGVISQIGEVPDATRGRKGSGLAEIAHRLDSKTTVAKLMLLAAGASAAGANALEFIKWLVHAKG